MPDEETGLIAIAPALPPSSLLSGSPDERIAEATAVANALAPLIDQQRLYATISGRKYVLYEGWTTLGALVGVFPQTVWTRPIEGGWEARVQALTLQGAVVGAADAQCLRSENNWKTRDDYALRSMAQTRAAAKALRMPLGFIMALAGYEATPAEEMPAERLEKPAVIPPTQRPRGRPVTLQSWACARCSYGSEGERISAAETNCPRCGHLRGAKIEKTGVPEEVPFEAGPPLQATLD